MKVNGRSILKSKIRNLKFLNEHLITNNKKRICRQGTQ